MTLEEKFTELQTLMVNQQTQTANLLVAIIDALGGAPPTPAVTLADIKFQLNVLNGNISAILAGDSSYHAGMLAIAADININTDTIINNNSLNAQRVIAALYATFCECTTDAPLLAPPIDITPTPLVDDAKCRRIQFYLSVFSTWLTSIANYGSTGASITGGVLESLLVAAGAAAGMTATGAEIGAAGGLPGIVVGAVIGAIVAAVYAFGGAVLVDYATQFASAPVQSALLAALYDAENADEGSTAFNTTIIANFDFIPASVINFLWYSAWSNDLYSGVPVVDDSAFDGTICAPEVVTECIQIETQFYGPGGYNYLGIEQAYLGWSITWVSGAGGSLFFPNGNTTQLNQNFSAILTEDRIIDTILVPSGTGFLYTSYEGAGVFELCPPV